MDAFLRTFIPATARSGVAMPAAGRYLPVFRRYVAADERVELVARCRPADRARPSRRREFVLLLTNRRLVLTRQGRLLRRLRRPYLNAEVERLRNVTWRAEPRISAVEFAATVRDGPRERFLINVGHPDLAVRIDALLSHVFKPRPSDSDGLLLPALGRSGRRVARDAAVPVAVV